MMSSIHHHEDEENGNSSSNSGIELSSILFLENNSNSRSTQRSSLSPSPPTTTTTTGSSSSGPNAIIDDADNDSDRLLLSHNIITKDPHISSSSSSWGGSLGSAVLGIIKAMVGPAILYLPHGMAQAGYLVALPMLFLVTALYLYSSARLLECWKFIKRQELEEQQEEMNVVGKKKSATTRMVTTRRHRTRRGGYEQLMAPWRAIDEEEDDNEEEDDDETALSDNNVSNTTATTATSLSQQTQNKKVVAAQQNEDTAARPPSTGETPDEDEENEKDDTQSNHLHGHHHTTTTTTPTMTLTYPCLAQLAYGDIGETCVQLGIALMQWGVCLTYLIFVPHNWRALLMRMMTMNGGGSSSSSWFSNNLSFLVCVMVAVEVPLCTIRDISKLAPTNLIANGLILYGLLTCLGFALREATTLTMTSEVVESSTTSMMNSSSSNDNNMLIIQQQEQQQGTNISNDNNTTTTTMTEHDDYSPSMANVWHHMMDLSPIASGWFLFVGTSVLLFEGSITLLLPLQEAVRSPQDRAQFPFVYRRVILGIIAFYIMFGMTCWMSFGEDVRTVLTTSLPPGAWAASVQLAYSVAVVLTFPLQNYPALDVLCRVLEKQLLVKQQRRRRRRRQNDSSSTSSSSNQEEHHKEETTTTTCTTVLLSYLTQHRNVLSTTLVVCLALVAVSTMESLDKVVSLMGSLLGCPIAFVFPPLIHVKLVPDLSIWEKRADYFVAGLGLVAMVMASVATILQW